MKSRGTIMTRAVCLYMCSASVDPAVQGSVTSVMILTSTVLCFSEFHLFLFSLFQANRNLLTVYQRQKQ